MSTPSFFNEQDEPFGKTFSEWTSRWWQAFDFQGWRRAMGPVFHVPGTRVSHKGEIQKKNNRFKISQKKAILFTIINWIQPEWDDLNKPTLISSQIRSSRANLNLLAMQRMDVVNVPGFRFSIDDLDVRPFIKRVSTKKFKIRGVDCVSDGFWLFLKPNSLEKGKHQVDTFGTCSSGATKLENSYEIEIC